MTPLIGMNKITIQLMAVVCAMVMFAGSAQAQATVKLSSRDTIRLTIGEADSVKATISPLGEKLEWKSEASGIAKVEKADPDSTWGRITGVAVGETKVVVLYGNSTTPATDTVVVVVYPKVTNVELMKDAAHSGVLPLPHDTTIGIGKTLTLYSRVSPATAYQQVLYSSSNSAIAEVQTVGLTGVVTGKSSGTAKITVSSGKGTDMKTDTILVKVNNPITALTFTVAEDTIPMQISSETDITAVATPNDADNISTLMWSIAPIAPSTTGVVTIVSNNGLSAKIKSGETPGNARLTVTSSNGKTASRIIKVLDPIRVTAMSLDKDTINLPVGMKDTLLAHITPANALNKKVKWTSSNASFASVASLTDTTAVVTASTVGVAMIVAETVDGAFKDTSYIYVRNAVELKGAKLTQNKVRVSLGKTDTLKVEFTPANATNKRVTWTSADTAIAVIDSNGIVTGRKIGLTKVYMKTVEGGFTDTCEVTVDNSDSNIEANAGVNVWGTENGLRVQSDKARTLAIYTVSGALYRRETVVGDRIISLPSGLYIVTLGEVSRKVAIP